MKERKKVDYLVQLFPHDGRVLIAHVGDQQEERAVMLVQHREVVVAEEHTELTLSQTWSFEYLTITSASGRVGREANR